MNFKTFTTTTHSNPKSLLRRLSRPRELPALTGILSTQDLRRIVAEMLG